jgi:hypothetical protein
MADVAELTMPKRKATNGPEAAVSPAAGKPFGRPPKPTGSPTQVRMDADIAALAKVVASIEGVSMTDLLSGILRPILNERAKQAGRKFLDERV